MAVHARIETPGGALPVFTTHLTYGPGLSRVRTAQASALARFVTPGDMPSPPTPDSPGIIATATRPLA